MTKNKTALVVLSGGQDSTTCLGVALKNYKQVFAIAFNYGQKHMVELMCARKVCDKHNVPLVVVDMSLLNDVSDSALTTLKHLNVGLQHPLNSSLPASFVPNRNAMFLTAAHAYAQKVNASHVITGVCQTDYSGYPDCRLEFVECLQAALNIGSGAEIKFVTPLMHLNKAQTFELAHAVGFLPDVLENSHTCYNGSHTSEHGHEWGYGCNQCPACELRRKGYEAFLELDNG